MSGTPFDTPVHWWERITFPTARVAYGMGFEAGIEKARSHAAPEIVTPPPVSEQVIHTPGEDSGFYVVQAEQTLMVFNSSQGRWMNVAAFPDAEKDAAVARADEEFQKDNGATRIRVIKVPSDD